MPLYRFIQICLQDHKKRIVLILYYFLVQVDTCKTVGLFVDWLKFLANVKDLVL